MCYRAAAASASLSHDYLYPFSTQETLFHGNTMPPTLEELLLTRDRGAGLESHHQRGTLDRVHVRHDTMQC